ncbi:MAG: hypothetical protein A2040_13590 [Rhodocyclales bacterium GWA2_65_19]|nr:MAG: hypothetical protein A2040_13590 [Rhodocyclales bacterium GWA2_65_19]
MFNPSRDQARQFLLDAWAKRRNRLPGTPMDILAADLVALHPEYHALFEAEDALTREWTPEHGETNPFLHLSLHLAIEEQLSIDQPPGIRAAFNILLSRSGDRHDALHAVLECLGEMIWRSQKSGLPPDGEAYLDCVRRAAG